MARGVYARRYSQAVFDIAQEADELDRWQSDLRKITHLTKDAAITTFLESPKILFADKAKLLAERLSGINPLALNLAYLLVNKGRLSIIDDIADDYQQLLNNYHGLEPTEVTTAIPLNEEDKLRLAEHLSTVVGKKVVIESKVDPSVIGGMIARIGGKLLDGSTRSKLKALKKDLAGARR